jgi:hypothetical protein
MMKAARVNRLVLLVLIAAPIAAPAKVDCENAYKSSLDRLRHMHLSPERLVALSRRALRIYDACQTGDLVGATLLFESLDRWKN